MAISFRTWHFSLLCCSAFCCPVNGQILKTLSNHVVEWQYESSKTYTNPFREIDLAATIVHEESSDSMVIPGFWAGGKLWKFRFSSPQTGTYRFTTACSEKLNEGLNGRVGKISVEADHGDHPVYSHGAIRVSNHGHYLEHEDGTPFFWLADSWWHAMTTRFRFPADFDLLAKDSKDKGFNVIQFAISFPCDMPP